MIILYIFLAVLLVISLLLFAPLPVTVSVLETRISIKVWSVIIYSNRGKKKKKDKNKQKGKNKHTEKSSQRDEISCEKPKKKFSFGELKNRISEAKELVNGNKSILGDLLRAIKLKHYRIVFTVGLDDPADTGIATGFMNAFATELDINIKNKKMPEQQSYVSTVPNFFQPMFKCAAEIKFSISLIRFLLFILKIRKVIKKNKAVINYIIQGESENE